MTGIALVALSSTTVAASEVSYRSAVRCGAMMAKLWMTYEGGTNPTDDTRRIWKYREDWRRAGNRLIVAEGLVSADLDPELIDHYVDRDMVLYNLAPEFPSIENREIALKNRDAYLQYLADESRKCADLANANLSLFSEDTDPQEGD